MRPQQNLDTAFVWDGTAAGELRIQQCDDCGALRHPPGPGCPSCHSFDRSWVVASGEGTVFSYVVHRHPPVPGQELPILLVLVDLPEGVRMVGRLRGVEPEEVAIGMAVRASYTTVDDDVTLVDWEASEAEVRTT